MATIQCHHCGDAVTVATAKVQRTEGCPRCQSDLRVCLNCRLYDPGASKQCREPEVEPVRDKDKANFCEWFEPGPVRAGSGRSGDPQGERERARAALDALFKKD